MPQLSIVESQLASIQQYHTETLALRAGIRWRKQGELSAGYLKRTAAQRYYKLYTCQKDSLFFDALNRKYGFFLKKKTISI
jgi:hypothetical protein